MRKIALAIAALLLATSAAHAEIKIGAVLSVTGPASFLGEPEKKTLEMYVKALNAAGGVNGEQITTIIYDDGGDASKARTFATRLVEEDKVDAVLGGSATGPSLAMAPVFDEAGRSFRFFVASRGHHADIGGAAGVGPHAFGANPLRLQRPTTQFFEGRIESLDMPYLQSRTVALCGLDDLGRLLRRRGQRLLHH